MRDSHALANWAGVKGWSMRAIGLFPNETKCFGDAQVGLYDLRMAERNHLAAGVEMLGKTRNHGIRVGGDRRVMLVVIFDRKGMRGIRVPIEVGHTLMGTEQRRSRNFGILRKRLNQGGLDARIGAVQRRDWR